MKTVMRTVYKILLSIFALLVIAYFCLPYYARQALIYWYPSIDDLGLFEKHTVRRADTCWEWAVARDYNTHALSEADEAYLEQFKTVSFLVIQNDSLVYEEYRDGWNDTLTSNLFSSTKSVVGLLVGVALDEGKIKSLDEPVGNYIPAFAAGEKVKVTIRHLLTMSGGLSWDEAYSSLFSVTTHGYYGNDLYDLVSGLTAIDEPGKQFSYRSGDTQLLAFVVEKATGKTISVYAEEKLWKPMQACRDAYWLLDKKGGDEKAFCCFHTSAREVARFARLLLRQGNWNGRQLVSEAYMREATAPATYLKDEFGKDSLDYYGYQIWIMRYKGMVNPYFRGMLGQYIIAIPSRNAIVVRLGHKKEDVRVRETTRDVYRYMDMALKILDTREAHH